MKHLVKATEARRNFFHIINTVLYKKEPVYITKLGSGDVIKLDIAPNSKDILDKLAGSISSETAESMKASISEARKAKSRTVKTFY